MRAQLYIALDTGMMTRDQFEPLYEMATEVSKLIGGFIRYLANGARAKT